MIRQLVYEIKHIANKIDQKMSSSVAEFGLTSQQGRILVYILKNNEVCQRDIEKRFNLSSPTITGIIDRLEKNGFVVRVPLLDRRYNKIIPTAKTYHIHQSIEEIVRNNDDLMSQGITDSELELASEVLKKILRNLEVEENDKNVK